MKETIEIYAEKEGSNIVIKSKGKCTEYFFYAVIAKILENVEKGVYSKHED